MADEVKYAIYANSKKLGSATYNTRELAEAALPNFQASGIWQCLHPGVTFTVEEYPLPTTTT